MTAEQFRLCLPVDPQDRTEGTEMFVIRDDLLPHQAEALTRGHRRRGINKVAVIGEIESRCQRGQIETRNQDRAEQDPRPPRALVSSPTRPAARSFWPLRSPARGRCRERPTRRGPDCSEKGDRYNE